VNSAPARRVRQLPAQSPSARRMKKRRSSWLRLTHDRPRCATRATGPEPWASRRSNASMAVAHERHLALAPALVRAQHTERPGVLAFGGRRQHQLRQRCGVHQPEIHALSGQRMHHVRRIAHQGHALRDVAWSREAAQGE